MILELVEIPSEILKEKTKEVEEIDENLLDLLDNMHETMLASDGVGIAAPQVNKKERVAVVHLDEDDEIFELINPTIVEREGEDVFVEGCLSIPHVFGLVPRASRIVVEYYNREGEYIHLEAFDYLARAIQHEVDHLDGILFTQRMTQEIAEDQLDAYYESYEEEHKDDKN